MSVTGRWTRMTASPARGGVQNGWTGNVGGRVGQEAGRSRKTASHPPLAAVQRLLGSFVWITERTRGRCSNGADTVSAESFGSTPGPPGGRRRYGQALPTPWRCPSTALRMRLQDRACAAVGRVAPRRERHRPDCPVRWTAAMRWARPTFGHSDAPLTPSAPSAPSSPSRWPTAGGSWVGEGLRLRRSRL